MTITIQAIYEGGVFRPLQPFSLADGQRVNLTVAMPQSVLPPPSEDEVIQRLKTARSIAEWVDATRLLPTDDGGYDVVKALNANRSLSGEGPLVPDEGVNP